MARSIRDPGNIPHRTQALPLGTEICDRPSRPTLTHPFGKLVIPEPSAATQPQGLTFSGSGFSEGEQQKPAGSGANYVFNKLVCFAWAMGVKHWR